MAKKVMKGCMLIVIALCFVGCDNEDVNPTDNTVHLGGYVSDTNGDGEGVASYWKDGVYHGLTSADVNSRASSMYIDGSSVLFGGVKRTAGSSIVSVMWRDGVESTINDVFGEPMLASRDNNLYGVWLGNGIGWQVHRNGASQAIVDTAYTFGPMSMTVNGTDVYVSGYSSGPPLPPNFSPPQHAQYWKNTQLIFRETEVSNGLSILARDSDIYMAGIIYPPGGLTSIACYWKNGQRVELTDGKGLAVARSIFVTNSHVYVAGMIDNQAVYWKDGEVTYLTTTGTFSMANSIFVKGEDVHVGGYEQGHPAYWKNAVKQDIPNQEKFGQIKFVVVGSNVGG